MYLKKLNANQTWAFVFYDQLVRLTGENMFYPTRKLAIEAANRHDLFVDKSNKVITKAPIGANE